MSDVLLIHVDRQLSAEQRQYLLDSLAPFHAESGLRPAIFDKGMTAEVQRDLSGLVAAIEDQTAAMRELAESNRAVVDLVIAQQAEDQEEDAPARPVFLEDPPPEG